MKKLAALFFCFIVSISYAKPLTLILDWFINPDHAPIFVAEQQGYFKAEGLRLKIIPPADPADPVKLVAARQADIGITYPANLLVAIDRGLPLMRIGSLIDTPMDTLAVLKSGPIKSIADLKGKRIGYSPGIVNNIMLKTMLAKHGLKLSEVTLVTFNYGQTQALLSHRIDAMTGAMRNFEIIEMSLAGQPARTFYPEKNGIPPYDELIFVTNKSEINDPRLKKFMLALQKGVDYLKKHPKKSWKTFAKNQPALNNQLNKLAWFKTLPHFANNPNLLNKKRCYRYAKFLHKAGLIGKIPPLNTYAKDVVSP